MIRVIEKLTWVFIILAIFLFYPKNSSHLKAEGNDMTKQGEQTEEIRKPAWADSLRGFYPQDPVKLTKEIADFYNKAKKEEIPAK